jgi:hypothetical protein
MIFMYDDERLYLVRYIDPHGVERTEEQLAEDAEHAIEMVERGWIPSSELRIVDVFMKINGSWNTEVDYDGQPDEYTEWMDYDPDC